MLSQTTKKLDEKVFFLIKAIDIVIDIFILKTKVYSKLILRFDKKYKNTQIRAKKFKKNIEKKSTKKS